MAASVLVAYAPRYGLTQDVAEAVAAALCDDGIAADLQAARTVKALKPYGAVVLGAPLQSLQWHKDALAFLDQHRSKLVERKVAVFALGPFPDEEEPRQELRAHFRTELGRFPWFTPVSEEVFDSNTLGLRLKVIPALKNTPANDVQDWAAVKTLANTLPEKLQLARG